MLEAALWGLVGGLALVLGALITFVRRPGKRLVAYVMAFGAGVLISAVAYDLTAEAFDLGGGDAVAIGLAAGALVSGSSEPSSVLTTAGITHEISISVPRSSARSPRRLPRGSATSSSAADPRTSRQRPRRSPAAPS